MEPRYFSGLPSGADWQALERNAGEFIRDAQVSLERAAAQGITKGLFQRNSSNIVVTYPTKQDLDPIDAAEVFERKSGFRTRGRTLYVHIPFCTGICTYCGFARSAMSEDDSRIPTYLDALEKESALMRSHLGFNRPGRVPVDSIYIGGGTPTLLTIENLERTFRMIHRDFALKEDGEFTLEISPETVTAAKLRLARTSGVNRISMGVESFDDRLLAGIGRRHDAKTVSDVVSLLRREGLERIDIDLIRNLPGSSVATLRDDVRRVTELEIPSVTSYEYVVKPKSIDSKRHARGLLGAVERGNAVFAHLLFTMAMESIGYGQRPLGWFLKGEDAAYEQQLDKWERGADLVPLGMSGYGYVNGAQFINHEGFGAYYDAIGSGRLPIEKGAVLDEFEQAHRHAIFALRSRVDPDELESWYGVDIFGRDSEAGDTLAKLMELNLIERTDECRFQLSRLGMLFQDQIQMELYSPAYKQRERRRRPHFPVVAQQSVGESARC
jgi:oxygen-independent coproporphyrinogen-3 oxidase